MRRAPPRRFLFSLRICKTVCAVTPAGRFTRWIGERPGLAVYIWHCLNESYGMPGLDILD